MSDLKKQISNCRGDIGIALSELSNVDEGECSLNTWAKVCNAIDYLNSVYEELKKEKDDE